jgi:PAS domain S-box-containing protein
MPSEPQHPSPPPEERRCQETFQNLERQTSLILQSAGEGIFGLDLQGCHTFVNPAAARMLGFTPEELIGQPSHSLYHHTKGDGTSYPLEDCPIYAAYKDGQVHNGDTENFWRKNGTSFPVEYTSTPIRDQDGTLLGAVVVFQDITYRRQCEKAIAQFRRQNDLILQAAGEGILGLDLDGKHTFVNPAANRFLGYEPGELLGKPSHSIWHHTKSDGSLYPAEECPIYGAYKDGLVHHGDEDVFWKKDGTSFPAQFTSTPIRDEHGRLVGAVVTFQDISEKKRMAAQLVEEAKLAEVTRVLGNIGHDIKNMLMPVLSGADLLRDEVNEQFPRLIEMNAIGAERSYTNSLDLLKMIETNARRIQDRVREIADAVKGVTSPPHFTFCQIDKIVEGVYETLQTYASEKGVTLHASGLESLPPVEVDERRIFNALYNLVNNAVPEVPRGGSVSIAGQLGEDHGTIDLAVADTGRGMPPEVRDRLFTPHAISTKATGTGLGTKIVKDVIDLHNGQIRVESEPGKGSTFYIRLPISRKAALRADPQGQ